MWKDARIRGWRGVPESTLESTNGVVATIDGNKTNSSGAGITEDAPDLRVTVRYPYKF